MKVSGLSSLLRRTILWTAILMVVPAIVQLLGEPPPGGNWTFWTGLHQIISWAGMFLPYASFAAGLEVTPKSSRLHRGMAALILAVMAFLLLGFASPHLEYKAQQELGTDLAARFPTGPSTVTGSLRLRAEVLEHPPEEVSFSVERPLQNPPNWLTYLIQSLFVLSLYSVLAVFLGALTASLTSGLSPPARTNARWAIGLVSGFLFFTALALGGDWVRASPMNSGTLGAWVPLFVPILELGILQILLARNRRGSTLSPPDSSNG